MTLLCLLQLLLQILRIGTARFRRHTIRCERLVAPLSFYIASSRHSNERRWMCELVSGMFLFHFYTSPSTKRRPSASSHIHTRRLSLSLFLQFELKRFLCTDCLTATICHVGNLPSAQELEADWGAVHIYI